MSSDPPSPHDDTATAPADDTATAPADEHAPGDEHEPGHEHTRRERVSHYRLGPPLGAGGMGVVFRAVDEKLGRPVAIKFLTAERSDQQARARFSREARAASALDHPNIGTVYEIGEADGAPFIVMALYEGETLRARLNRGPIPVAEVVAIARQLCAALAVAHAAGIVHRDLKPANVMLLADGTLKLLDFGLAKLTSTDESSLTREGSILGTLLYMAPEQLQSGDIDSRADLWALGALLYEMLSGRPPFGTGPAGTIVGRILTEEPPPLTAPEDLTALTRQLLRKDRRDRIASATEVGRLLDRRLAPEPPRARGGVLVGLVVVLLVGALGLWAALRNEDSASGVQAYQRATIAFSLGRYDEAAAQFEESYRQSRQPAVLYNLAQSYRMSSRPERALDLYKQYLRAEAASGEDGGAPNPEVVKQIAELQALVDEQHQPKTQEVTTEEQAQAVELAEPLFNSATAKFNRHDYDGAARDWQDAYELAHDPLILYNAGQSFRLAKQYRRAIVAYTSLSRASHDPAVRAEIEKHIEEMRAMRGSEDGGARPGAGEER